MTKKNSLYLIVRIFIFIFSYDAFTFDQEWDVNSDPNRMSKHFIKKFSSLPLFGKVPYSKKFWSGDYWALKKGNINYRWYAKIKTGFNYKSPSRTALFEMSIPQLAELAPSEKYDILVGRYDYPLKKEVNLIAKMDAESWEGICHGWAAASMNHDEPTQKLLTNTDGIEIPFGSSDIKALLSYYYAFIHTSPENFQIGKRCFKKNSTNDPDCVEDLNAGAFHIIISNRLGMEGRGVLADLERFNQVWNHPIVKYKSFINKELTPQKGSAKGTVKNIEIKTIITYVDENNNDWSSSIETEGQKLSTKVYQYLIDIDENDTIIGGSWISKVRPDFLWMIKKPVKFKGILSQLDKLLEE